MARKTSLTGVKYGLDATSNVDEKGILRNGLPEYEGKRVWDANQPIIDLVKSRGALLHTEKTEHSYPHCWRCHNPVIFRATEQWFISMETPMPGGKGKEDTLRTRTLSEIKSVKWDPAWGEERLSNMIPTRPDWCISRQRVWGVPIAVFLCEGCGKPLNDHAINRKVVELFARSGADAWFTPEPDSIVPAGDQVSALRRNEVRKGNRHLRRLARIRRELSGAGWRMNRNILGLPIFTLKAATSIADGSSLPCSAPWARAARLRIAAW